MNPIEVELPDGRILEFPAGTPNDVMDREIQGLLSGEGPAPDTGLKEAENTAITTLGPLYKGTVGTIANAPSDALAAVASVLPDPRPGLPDFIAKHIPAPLGAAGVKKLFSPDPMLKKAFSAVGAPYGTSKEVAAERNIPHTPGRKILGEVAEMTGSALSTMLPFMAAARTPRATSAAPKISDAFVQPFRSTPAAATTIGAASGATAGAAGAVTDQVGLPELKPVAQILGSFGPAGALGAYRAARSAYQPMSLIAQARNPETAKGLAGQALRETGLTPGTEIPPPALPGMKRTVGMALDNPDMIAFERAILGRVGGMNEIAAMKEANRSVIDAAIARASGNLTPTGASKKMAESYRARETEVGDAARAAYEPLEAELFATKIASNIVRTKISGFYKKLDLNESKDIPGDIRGRLNALMMRPKDKAPTLGEIDGVRSRALAEARAYREVGQGRKAHTMDRVASFLDDVIAKAPASAEKKSLLDPARTQYREYKTQYEDNPLVGRLFEKGRAGYKIPGSEFAPKAFNSPDEALEHLITIGPDHARKLGAKYLSSILRQSMHGNVDDFTRAKVNQFLISNRDALRQFYGQDDWKAILKIRQAVTENARFSKGTGWTGSPTSEKIMANRFVDKFVIEAMPWGRGLVRRGEETLANNTQKLLMQAAFDPQLARALVLSPKRGNVAFISADLKKKYPSLAPTMLSLLGRTVGTDTRQQTVQ